MKRLSITTLLTLLLVHSAVQAAPSRCGELKNSYGPYDYRRGSGEFLETLRIVEQYHFNADVESGLRGQSSSTGGDLSYVLRAFPNHTRALSTLARLAQRQSSVHLAGMDLPVECYFDRAVRFAPDDPAARAMYGSYLYARGQYDIALKMFNAAVGLGANDATIVYNLGLTQLKLRQFEAANLSAQRAYALGFTLPGLKNMLVAAGKWDESVRPPPAPVPDAPADATGKAE
jgi:tetratricopeptide (TPR) repeat protein